jgi:hypothetical protein
LIPRSPRRLLEILFSPRVHRPWRWPHSQNNGYQRFTHIFFMTCGRLS